MIEHSCHYYIDSNVGTCEKTGCCFASLLLLQYLTKSAQDIEKKDSAHHMACADRRNQEYSIIYI